MKSFLTIRAQLILLVMAISLPMVGVLVYTIYENAQQRVVEAQSTAQMLAMTAASDIERVLISNHDLLVQMSMRPQIRKLDPKNCDNVLWDFHQLFPKSANMTVIDISGTAICSAVPQPGGKPVSVANAPWFKKSLAHDGFVVSDPFFGPITGRWVTVLTFPIHDALGRKIGFLGLPLDLALYVPNLSSVPLIPGTDIGILDSKGTFVWRNLETEKWVGKRLEENIAIQKILRGTEGEMIGVDSVHRLYHVDNVNDVDWKVYVGIPTEFIRAQLRQSLLRNAMIGSVILVLILMVAWAIARQISRPIGALASASRAVRKGQKEVRAEEDGPPEIVEVAREFNAMLNVRMQSEAALRESEARLAEALIITSLGHWEYEAASDEFILNDQYYLLHRTTAMQIGGYRVHAADYVRKLIYREDAEKFMEHLKAGLHMSGGLGRTEVRIACADGAVRWVQLRFKVEVDDQGRVSRLLGTSQDITERKEAEINQVRLNRSLRLLSDCNTALVHAREESQLLADICRLIVEQGGYRMAWVGYAEHDEDKTVRVVARYGDGHDYLGKVRISWADVPHGRGPTGVAIRTGVADANRDFESSSRMALWRDAAFSSGFRASIALPLAGKHGTLGALTIYSGSKGDFPAEEVLLLEELANDLAYGIETLRTRIEHQQAEQQLNFLAHHDMLTSLPNRLLLRMRFEAARAHAESEKSGIAVMFLDLDNFKQVNDSLGHNYGDKLLVKVVERLQSCLRDTDTISRQGGDEFIVLLPRMHDIKAIDSVAKHIIHAFNEPFEIDSYSINTSFSIGISLYPDHGAEFDTLLRNADTALYQAKDSGRDTHRFFSEKMNADAQEQLNLQGQLRSALSEQEFLLHFQPQIDIPSGRIIGAEALIRWQHPELGLVSPGRFIPLAERSGLIIQMGEWVLYEACRQARQWHEQGHPLVMAVNLSALQFRRGNLLETVANVLKHSGLPAELLELELTESILLQDIDTAIRTLHSLREMGVKLSIDDFGTGYSSLSYLKRLAVNKLKIDQSFVRDLAEGNDSATIIRAIIQLARTLQLTVIAEGVETESQLAFLRENGCNEAQGYWYSRPVSAGEFVKLLGNGNAFEAKPE